MNSVVATGTAGIPRLSSLVESCKLHVVHEPQSASASITASHFASTSFSITASGAGLVNVGFIARTIAATP